MTEEPSNEPEAVEVETVDTTSTPEQDTTPIPDSVDAAGEEAPSAEEAEDKPSRAQQRIQQLVGDKKAAMEYGNFWKDKFEQSHKPVEPVVAPLVMPTLEDCDFDDNTFALKTAEYYGNVIDQQVTAKVSQALDAQSQATAQAGLNDKWNNNAAIFAAENPDFNEVAFATPSIYEVIKTSEAGPAVAYYLGQNSSELQKIEALPPMEKARALFKIETSLPKPTVKQKQTTQAPAPMSPVGGQQPNVSLANESIEDFMKRRNQEQADKRAKR